MFDLSIITSIYDGYDTLKPVMPQTGAKVEWVFVSESPPSADLAKGYAVIDEKRGGMHPNRAAKFPKMAPQDYVHTEKSIWIDGSFRVTSPTFALDILHLLERTDIAQFVHPWRDCVYEEAEETLKLERYADVHDLVKLQIYRYQTYPIEHPKNWGLWATGIIARNHTDQVNNFGQDWLFENMNFSYQDQISEAVELRYNDLRPSSLPGTHFSNPWVSYEGSGRHE